MNMESRALQAEREARSYQKQYNSLHKKKTAEFQTVVECYQRSEPFLALIDEHDNKMRPLNMSIGWDRAVNVISDKYPDVVDPRNFPTPDWEVNKGSYVDYAAGSSGNLAVPRASSGGSGKGRLISGSNSKGSTSSGSSQSQSLGARPSGKGPMLGRKRAVVVRQPLPGKGVRNELSPQSSEGESEEEDGAEEQPVEDEVVAESDSEEEESSSGEEGSSSEGGGRRRKLICF